MLKIALVAQNISPLGSQTAPESAAQADRMCAVAKAMARQGHRVTIYARKDSPALAARGILAPGVTVEHLTAGPPGVLPAEKAASYIPQFAQQLAGRWRRGAPDVAYPYYWTSGLAALAAARDFGVPVVQTFHSLGSAELRHHLPAAGPAGRIRLETTIARHVPAVLASSSDEIAELARLGVPRTAVRLVPVGVDTTLFTDQGRAARRGRRPRVLALGAFDQCDGLDLVIRAMTGVPEAELVIAGGPASDQLDDDPRYQTLAKLAAEVGIYDRIRFIGDVTYKQLPVWLRSANLAVTAASYEPFGLAAIQAMACGVPVIASAVGGNADAVVDGTTGALVRPGQPEVLGRRIRELLASPARLEAFGMAAADRARVRYSWDRIAKETLAASEHVMAAAGPGQDHSLDELPESELATA